MFPDDEKMKMETQELCHWDWSNKYCFTHLSQQTADNSIQHLTDFWEIHKWIH